MSVKLLYSLAAVAVLGCASSGVPDPSITANTRRTSILGAEEIEKAHADITTAYDAVARLRPNWLAAHGVTSGQSLGQGTEYALVYMDGQSFDLNQLRSIPAYHVGVLRYYDITQAGARFGIRGGSSGVIEVTLKTSAR